MKFLQRKGQADASTPAPKPNKNSSSPTEQNPNATSDNNDYQSELLQNVDNHIFCTVRDPWTWVMQDISEAVNHLQQQAHMTLMDTYQDLPSGKLASVAAAASQSNLTRPARIRRNKTKGATLATLDTLRVDVVTNHQQFSPEQVLEDANRNTWQLQSFHGTSEAFDGLEDKDEFVRTLKRCRCEHLELSPPSVLINWDVSVTECRNLVGESMPALLGGDNSTSIGVLKEPMGKGGAGVFFVHNADEIHEIMERNRKRAVEEPGLLDDLIAQKGRIPSWVLQAEVKPCLLVRDRRKFHIRTYVVCIENVLLDAHDKDGDLMKLFVYDHHEIRIANEPVPEEETSERDRNVHIMDATAERKLIREEPELLERKLNQKVELFAAKTFNKHLRPDIERRIALSAEALEEENKESRKSMVLPHKFVVAGLDLMVTEDERIYLLEVNVNPSAPTKEFVSPQFQTFLLNFQSDLLELVTTRGGSAAWPNSRFVSTETILERKIGG